MKTVKMELPSSQIGLIQKIMEVKLHDEVFFGEGIIRNLKEIRINKVAVQGDSLQIFGNHIECGFVEKRDVISSNDEKIGISFDIKEKTADVWNADNFHHIQFTRNDVKYCFEIKYDF